MRRTVVAFAASLALHAALLAGTMALGARLPAAPSFNLLPVTLKDAGLPLRPPVRKARPRAREPRRTGAREQGEAPAVPGARKEVGPATPAAPVAQAAGRQGDVSAYGPEGSRIVAILRLDRLRAGADAKALAGALDDVLRLFPDRRRLLDGTGLDLQRDFDALLVATPDPLDDAVTFLAARHRLRDAALRAALDRGARAAGATIVWKKERGHLVGVRKGPRGGASPERDTRLLLLPAPGLLAIAPPAYAKQLLGGGRTGEPASGPGSPPPAWGDLVARIDAEDGAVPADAAFALTAVGVFAPASPAPPAAAATGASGAVPAPSALPAPARLSILIGTPPEPFLELRAELDREEEARSFEARWPALKQDLLANPLVAFARVDQLLASAQLRREGCAIFLRARSTGEEMTRLLRTVASLGAAGDAGRAPVTR